MTAVSEGKESVWRESSRRQALLSFCLLLLLAALLTVSLPVTADAQQSCAEACVGDFTCGQECLNEAERSSCGEVPPFREHCRNPFRSCTCSNSDVDCTPVCGNSVSCSESCNQEKTGAATTCGALGPQFCEEHSVPIGDPPPAATGGEGSAGPDFLFELATGRFASQSSVDFGGVASRAVDGIIDGNFSHGSVTHTQQEVSPWWMVSICPGQIELITVYNRTDCCSDRLNGADVWAFRIIGAGQGTWDHVGILTGVTGTYYVRMDRNKRPGEYTRVGINFPTGRARILSLSEVSVTGVPQSPAGCPVP